MVLNRESDLDSAEKCIIFVLAKRREPHARGFSPFILLKIRLFYLRDKNFFLGDKNFFLVDRNFFLVDRIFFGPSW